MRSNVSLMNRLYIWSIIFEMMLFFYLGDPNIFQISLARILQITFIAFFFWKLLSLRQLFNFDNSFIFYFLFLLLIVAQIFAIYLIKAIEGEFFNYLEPQFSSQMYQKIFIEFFKYLYFFIYFVIIGRVILSSEIALQYFFKYFRIAFSLSLFVGAVSLFLSAYDFQIIPRQLNYSESISIGFRFNGLFGEPRDAVVALIFGLSVLFLESVYLGHSKFKKIDLLLIFSALILTFSGSLVIAVLIAPLVFVCFSRAYFLIQPKILLIIFGILFLATVSIIYSPRLMLYFDQMLLLPSLLSNSEALPYHISTQMPNIYPFWVFWNDLNLFNSFFGYGVGTSASIKILDVPFNLSNPNSQLTRLVYEFGLIGLYLWTYSFYYPSKMLMTFLNKKQKLKLFLLFVFLISACLAHRSHLGFIYLGLIYALLNIYRVKLNIENNEAK